jgi:AcrR family transcriptional regulator
MLDAAVSVFSRRGYHAASMDEIAELAGISKPMVYAYLGVKEDLFAACIRREADRMMNAIAAEARDSLPPDEQLWRALCAFFSFVDEYRDSWSMLYHQARGEGSSLATELDSIRDRIVELVSYLLRRSRLAHGTRGTDTDLRAFAYALVGAAESLANWLIDHPEEFAETTAARLMNLAWVGFRDLLQGDIWRPGS